ESQFNKLKTFVYQKLAIMKIDPRVVTLGLHRKEGFQDNTLTGYFGENFFHDPLLKDLIARFGPPGELRPEDLVKSRKHDDDPVS
ncbi:MAG: hypothetical protein Q6353_004590, partial [Candidatus Sigynarchaeum springense]